MAKKFKIVDKKELEHNLQYVFSFFFGAITSVVLFFIALVTIKIVFLGIIFFGFQQDAIISKMNLISTYVTAGLFILFLLTSTVKIIVKEARSLVGERL